MTFSELDLKTDKSIIPFQFQDKTIGIRKYLPIEEKNDLINISLQFAETASGLYDEVKLDVFFHLNLVYSYTDLEFSTDDKIDEYELYDKLVCSGFLDEFVSHLPEDEYNYLLEAVDVAKNNKINYNQSFASVVKTFIEDLPGNIKDAAEILDSFDKNKFVDLLNYAKANGFIPEA